MAKLQPKHTAILIIGGIAAITAGVYWYTQYDRSHHPLQTAFLPSTDRYGSIIEQIAFSPDGSRIIAEDESFNLGIWDVKNQQWTQWLKKQNPDTPEYAALSGTQIPKRYVWLHEPVFFPPPDIPNFPPHQPVSVDASDKRWFLDHDDARIFTTPSTSNTFVAYGRGNGIISVVDIHRKHVLFATQASPVKRFAGKIPIYSDTLCGLCFSPDEKSLVSMSVHNDVFDIRRPESAPGPDLQIALRDARTGAVIRRWAWKRYHEFWSDTLGDNTRPVLMKFSPDGGVLAIVNDRQVRLWDIRTGELIKTLYNSGNDSYPFTYRLLFFPKRQFIASSGLRGKIQIWNTHSGKLVQVFQAQPENYYGMELALSPDERLIANSGRTNKGRATLQVWDVSNL